MGIFEKLSSNSFELLCVLQLAFGSTFFFAGYDTHGIILESVLHSVSERYPEKIDEYAGYYGQSVGYIFLTLASFIVPVLVRYAGPKWTVFMGSICFTVYQSSFLHLNSYFFFCASALAGIGYALFYAGYGCYLTEHSTEKHLARNSSITWGLACTSLCIGGIVLRIDFYHNTTYTKDGRYREFSDLDIRTIFGIFAAISLLANITFFFMPSRKVKNTVNDATGCLKENKGLRETFLATFKTMKNVNIWLLAPFCLHLGGVITFFLGPYPTSLTFTPCLSKSRILLPMFAIAAGLGEFSTTVLVTWLSPKYSNFGRVHAVAMGTVASAATYILALIATPQYATLFPTTNDTLLVEPSIYIALVCGYFLGMSDCAWNTSRSCYISWLLPNNCAEGFAISRIFQSVSSCAFYFLSSIFDLYTHLAFLASFLVLTIVSLYVAVRRQDRICPAEEMKTINGAMELKNGA